MDVSVITPDFSEFHFSFRKTEIITRTEVTELLGELDER